LSSCFPMIQIRLLEPAQLLFEVQRLPGDLASPNLVVSKHAHSHCKCVRPHGQRRSRTLPVTLVIPCFGTGANNSVQQRKGKALINVVSVHGRPLQPAGHECDFQ
jgi:hypothetical protein